MPLSSALPIALLALAAATAQAQTDWHERLLDGARKEGQLLLYTTFPSEYAIQLIEPFEKHYGIKVNHWRARSEIVLRKALAEGRAGGPTADVITIITPQLEALRREGLLQAVQSPNQKDHPPFAIPAHHEWVAQVQHVFVHAYNTSKVRKDELPKAWHDLLAPHWKGKLAI